MAASESGGETVGVAVPPLQLGATRKPTTPLVPTEGTSVTTSVLANSPPRALGSTAPKVPKEENPTNITQMASVVTTTSMPTESSTLAGDLTPSTLDTASQIPQHSVAPVADSRGVPTAATERISTGNVTEDLTALAPETAPSFSTTAVPSRGIALSDNSPNTTKSPEVVESTAQNLTYPKEFRPGMPRHLLLGPAILPDWRLYLILVSAIALAIIVMLLIGWILTCICLRVRMEICPTPDDLVSPGNVGVLLAKSFNRPQQYKLPNISQNCTLTLMRAAFGQEKPCVIRRNTAEELLSIMNKLHPKIKFTMEKERDNQLSFLARNICSKDTLDAECARLKEALLRRGYPARSVQSSLNLCLSVDS
ncbi:hypothetical protein SprV_0802618200 [Sparganum proliferum]